MKQSAVKALVVVDRQEHSGSIGWGFEESVDCAFMDVKTLPVDVCNIENALWAVAQRRPDILLLNTALPSLFLVKVVSALRDRMPALPLMILPDIQRAVAELEGTPPGDHDEPRSSACTDDDSSRRDTLARAMRSTHLRVSLQQRLLQLAQKDDLTGLHNRRGFMALATQQLRWACKTQEHLLLFFADLDGLKQINDQFGHAEGDNAIVRAAASIKQTFREFDITARVSGDEFVAVIVSEPGRGVDAVLQRLRENLRRFAATETRYPLSLSVGVAEFDPDEPCSLSNLMRLADAKLYRQKRARVDDCPIGVAAANAKAKVSAVIGERTRGALEPAMLRG
ncbi:MAG TPA: GGDEF domain-containing protein [Steroidobacteraceae bacterium]|nr:GGDEF domain-containing protein [Steroidobacteraceae bacterium]